MSDEKRLKARVAHKHKKEAEWYLDVYTAADSTAKRSDPFIPLNGELIIFDEDENHTKKRFKIGDGEKDVIELPFALDIDSLEKEWDLIITDPDDLATKLATATGNVLVKLKDKYTETLTVNLNSGLKLLDFGNSYIESVNLNPNLIDSNAETAIRNLITSDDTSANNSGSHIKLVSNVKNCRGIIHYKDCSCIEDSDIASAESCTNINHSRTVKSTRSNFGVFVGCSRINNIDVSSHADENLLFDECRYISNIRHSYAEGNPSYVRYSVCTYVDPYTCAGYVSPDNSGKVPVPDDKGGVVFKEFMPKQSNPTAFFRLIGVDSDGNYSQKSASNSFIGSDFVPLRTSTGQIGSPNQDAYPPTDDQYISKRFANTHYLSKIENIFNHAALYAQKSNNDPDSTFLIVYASGAYGSCIVQRDIKGNINAPNQITSPPTDDQYISRRYFEANAPSGSKLYRHIVEFSKNWDDGNEDDSACYGQVIVYKTNNTPITSLSQINGMAVSGASGQLWDAIEGRFAVISEARIYDSKFYIAGFTTTQLANITDDTIWEGRWWDGSELTIRDTITEV